MLFSCQSPGHEVPRWHVFAGLVISVLSLASGQQRAPIDERERIALLALYNSTNGAGWKNHSGWKGRPGSECTWFGVECGFDHEHADRQTVTRLSLENNNLVGTLPSEMNNLDLDDLRLAGNHLSGVLPHRILNKWEAGPLRLSGYASQFTAQIDEIILRRRTAVLCTDYEATLRPDGSVAMRSEKCRGSGPNPRVYCEIRTRKEGWGTQEVDRLVRFMETSGFFELESGYFAPMTHGGTFEIEVLRRGRRQKVVDYGAYGPHRLWAVEKLIQGILEGIGWDAVREARDCGFTVRDR